MNSAFKPKVDARIILAIFAVALAMLVLPFAFFEEKAARVIFYWCGYFSVAGVLYEVTVKKKMLSRNILAMSFFALGLMFVIWSVFAEMRDARHEALLMTAGKRMLLASFIMAYIIHVFREGILPRRSLARLAWGSVTTGFVVATIYGIVQGYLTHDRITLGINRATLSAYGYSALSLALATSLLNVNSLKLRKPIFVAVAALSVYVVCLTETRAAMVLHTLMIAILALRFFPVTRNPISLAIVCLGMVVGLGSNLNVIESRAALTLSEYQSYQNNDDHTSLGSRFTMWKTGLLAFKQHPFGQTQLERNDWIKAWLNAHGNPDSFALEYLDVHLHNEFIQYASVFGIAGVLILTCFYWSAIIISTKTWGVFNPVSAAGLAFMLYGATDVLLTCIELIVMLSVMMTLTTLMSGVIRASQAAGPVISSTPQPVQPSERAGIDTLSRE